jgi:hypothetical protein
VTKAGGLESNISELASSALTPLTGFSNDKIKVKISASQTV